jgi:outer membrane protein
MPLFALTVPVTRLFVAIRNTAQPHSKPMKLMHHLPHWVRPLAKIMAVLAIGTAGLATSAIAQSLVDLYGQARTSDAAYFSAKAQADANLARSEQARAGLLPSAALSAGASQSYLAVAPSVGPNSDRGYGTQQFGVNGSYPLYRPANQVAFDQGQKLLEQSEAQLLAADQDLMVRISQAYFDVLASQDSLTFVLAQKTAVAEQLAAAKRNFEVGTSTITDSREAQARFDLVVAQQLAAENDLLVKRLALDQAVGKTGIAPKPVALPLTLPGVAPADVNTWVQQSELNHPTLRQLRTALDVAVLETARARAGEKPTVDVVGNYGMVRNDGGSSQAAIGSWVNSATVGIQLNMPLYTGNATQNRIKETLALEEKARVDLEGARRTIAQAVRAAYFGVLSGQGQVKALEAAEASSQSALEANQLGYKVGVRINIDVLNAQSQLFQTKRDLARARYDVLVGSLRLRQANGSLAAGDLSGINALLVN